jgi:hypothetical protein
VASLVPLKSRLAVVPTAQQQKKKTVDAVLVEGVARLLRPVPSPRREGHALTVHTGANPSACPAVQAADHLEASSDTLARMEPLRVLNREAQEVRQLLRQFHLDGLTFAERKGWLFTTFKPTGPQSVLQRAERDFVKWQTSKQLDNAL